MSAEARYSVKLFGEFHVDGPGAQTPEANSARLHELLAYLILHRDRPQSRQQLAFLFWPDATETQARNALRQLLFQARKALPQAERFIHADTQTIQWLPDLPLDLDIARFQAALAQAEQLSKSGDPAGEEGALTRAVDAYRGDLLPACYDDWIVPERNRLREQCIAALVRLSQLSEDKRDYATALKHAQRLQRLDPLREPTCLTLLRLHALNRDRASALRTYRCFAETLGRELGVVPSEPLREAYARLAGPAAQTQPLHSRDAALPMIGRHNEWRKLLDVWQRVQLGSSQLALIAGEAGIGKSRLAEELLAHLREQGIVTAQARAYAAEGQLAFAPVTDWLRSPAVLEALNKLDKLWLTEVARLLPELLTNQPGLTPPPPLAEYWQRQRFFEALARAALAKGRPLLLLLDDLQWCDKETLEWLRFLVRFDSRAKLLLVATVRLEEITPGHAVNTLTGALRRDDQLIEILLPALDAAESAKIATQITGRPLDDAQATRLFQETEGNPLFVVETARAGSDGAQAAQTPMFVTTPRLPPKVYSVISNRLAQLSAAAREVAGLAAIIGRAFTSDMLANAGDLSENALVSALDELWQRRIVRETANSSAFDFSHDKIRDVAYAEVSPLQRRRLHRRVAQALERTAGNLDTVSAQIAAHYEQAGMVADSATFYRRAAGVAQRVYAYDDAIALLQRGLSQADRIADPREQTRLALELQLDLAPPIRIARGWASPELETPLRRAVELSRQIGDMHQQARAQFSLATFHMVRAELAHAQGQVEELLSKFPLNAGSYAVMACAFLTGGAVQKGDWAVAEAEYQRGHGAYDESQHAEHVALMGPDFGVHSAAWSAHGLWFAGLPDQALRRGHEALELANRLAHPFSQALALDYLAMQYVLRREFDRTLEYARQARDISERFHVSYYVGISDMLAEWASAICSPSTEAAERLAAAIERFRASGGRIRLTMYLGLLAECLGEAGEIQAALAALDEGFDCAERFGEHWLDAELYRLRGELFLRYNANLVEAESSLTTALEIAAAQGAPPLELRAALSLAKVRQVQRRADGHVAVEAALARLTEGFDQPDVIEARALLAR